MTTFRSPSRPFPPPCWSQEETASLINAYRNKWYSLRRGHLRASDWQDVADAVSNRHSNKTSTQCRHKMEKLRKRYRADIQRAAATSKGHRSSSPWIHFNQMDSMEKGSPSSDQLTVSIHQESVSESESEEANPNPNTNPKPKPPNQRFHNLINCRNGFQFKIPGRVALPDGPDVNNPVKGMVAAIKRLGDGFVRIERMKMEKVKEVELMRLEMEMKRTEMIIDSHRKLADSMFSNSKKNKKLKRMDGYT